MMDGVWQGGQFVLQSTIEERIAKLTAERDKLQGVVFAYRLALLADGVPAKVLDEIANGVPQEAKP